MIRRSHSDPISITPSMAITEADLLAKSFAGDSWATWTAVLKAAYAEALSPHELKLFHAVAGARDPPARKVSEMWIVAGRRAGKDSVASAVRGWIHAASAALQSPRCI